MYSLSNPQKLIYEMEKYVGGAVAVICGSVLLEGKLDVDELTHAVHEIFRINDVLRTRIVERDGQVGQEISDYQEVQINTLCFESKEALSAYAEEYAQMPVPLDGALCEIQILLLPEQCGILAKCHHIIGDAWTLTLIASQLCALLIKEEPLAFSYSEYLERESDYVRSDRRAKDKAFFLERFKSFPEVVYLSEKQGDSYEAKRSTFHVGISRTDLIRTYAREHRTSPFALFFTAFAIYFSRVKDNARNFYIGTPVLNRGTFREKHTMGMFINTVPVLVQVDYGKSFAQHLAVMQRDSLSALRHQKFHYNDILTAIRQECGFTEKLYDVVLSYQNAAVAGAGGGIETTWYHSGTQVESLQIHIDDRDSAGNFRIHLDYRTDKFTSLEIERMYNYILNILLDALSDDTRKPGELKLLSDEEKRQLLYDFNDTSADYPRDKCVHTLFEERAAQMPDKVAVIACDRTLTYGELNGEANRIAHGLIGLGVRRGDIVAFALPRDSRLIPVMFGILKAGAAYLPIDPDYPQERISFILEDSGAKLFVTEKELPDLLAGGNIRNLNLNLSSDSLCYCIYTSGSTGKPKGVTITHHNAVNFCCYDNSAFHQTMQNCCDCVLATNNIVFDITMQEIHFPLLQGKQVFLMKSDVVITKGEADRLDRSCDNLALITTPTKISVLLDDDALASVFKKCQVIMVGAEKFTLALYRKIRKLTDSKVFNGYGPTETTCGSCYKEVVSEDITIGCPIANTQIYIVDKYMNPVPIGVVGELCIGGDGVGAGYLNRPELTAEKFVKNPFSEGKLYKTGDLAFWREDGNIVYVGRNDFQVKIRGLRVELGEIESAISSVDGVGQAVAVVRRNEAGRQLICAFYTGNDTVGTDAIKNAIREKLPRYMMPHIFMRLDAMPLTSSGKVDRKSLPEVDLSACQSDTEYAAPTTECETILVFAVSSVLGLDRVGMLDNFFDLGGDSLKAIELTAALERSGYHVEVKTIFEMETLRELAVKLLPAETGIENPIPVGDILATPAQMRIYTAQNMSGGTAYNVPYAFRVERLDPVRLQAAVDQMVARHEILRTRFENRDGQIMQVMDDAALCRVEKLDSGDLTAFIRPFDLGTAPLFRVGYFENIVLLDMHHIIIDGGSLPIFLRELNELYMGRKLKVRPVQYREFAIKKQGTPVEEAYWLEIFADEPPVLELHTDYPRQGRQNYEGTVVYESIDGLLHEKICGKAKALGITPYAFYMGAFFVLLSKFSGSEDIVVGTPASGRNGKFLNALGMFVNTLALRSRPEGEKRVKDFLREIRAAAVDALANQSYPYGELVKKLGIHSEGRNPLFDVMFAYQSGEMAEFTFGDKPAEVLPVPATTSKYDFTFSIIPQNNGVVLMVEYCTALFKEDTIQRFIVGYRLLLSQMLDEGKQINELSAITEAERNILLHDFNDTTGVYPQDKCVHTLFEERVAQMLDKTAVIACDRALTYGKLNEEANRIAHGLIGLGVRPGDIVAFALPRNSNLIPVMFGILKAGAAYLPIDPDYPQERISFMLEDSGAKLFVTERELPDLLAGGNSQNLSLNLPSDSLCYCIYTSGSTGKPKGVTITHRNAVNFCCNDISEFHQGIKARCDFVLATNNVVFDITMQEIHLPLLQGKQVFLMKSDVVITKEEAERLDRYCDNLALITTPTKISLLLDDDALASVFRKCQVIMVGAEMFTPALYWKIRKLTDSKVFNGYGPTETTCGSCYQEVASEDITIGRPIANTQIYIVDRYMNPVPIGVAGELCIAGDGVGAGYLNRPELTAEKFVKNPFGEGKLYKTGDLASWREDGNIIYVGRNDFQVKIRGLRVELGEIESAITFVDGVGQAVVVVRRDKVGRQLICAFYTGSSTAETDVIKAAIREKLPRYMMPHIFTRLAALPLTPSGKVDRKSLQEVDLTDCQDNTEYVPPKGEMEKGLADIMKQVLGYSPIGREDDFFDLGGDSLKAIEFVSKAHTEGIYFTLQNVFDYPTVGMLREYIESGDKPVVSYQDADFTSVNTVLAKNRAEIHCVPDKKEIKNLLLTGATGFLGIHILADYLESDKGMVYCLVRGQDQEDSEKRLEDLLLFYFGEKYICLLGTQIKVLCGDLQKENFGLDEKDYKMLLTKTDTVINAAATVKHYGSYRFFHEINVESVERLIRFCRQGQAKLIHISTLSVSGNGFDTFDGYVSPEEKYFFEDSLYVGQPFNNVYAQSKFEAEKLVLKAIADGLHACIMRMGNLTNRASDGVFQANHETNAAAQRIKGMLELGVVPDYLIDEDMYVEFTPIDEAARAILLLTHHFDPERTVFHINSTKVVYLDKLMELFTVLGYPIRAVTGEKFVKALLETAKQSSMEHIFGTFINDLDKNDRLNYDSNIHIENSFTERYLRKLGFTWGEIGLEYLKKYVDYFVRIGYWRKA